MIVADTHVIIWDALKPELLSPAAKDAIREANRLDGIIFCEISLWEIAMLMKKKRLSVDVSYQEFIRLVSDANNYIFKGISLDIMRGQITSFMGPSGTGKTTLLNLVAGIDKPDSGSINVNGTEVNSLSESKLAKWRSLRPC